MTLGWSQEYPGLTSEERESGHLSLGDSEYLGTSALWIPAAADTLVLDPQCR